MALSTSEEYWERHKERLRQSRHTPNRRGSDDVRPRRQQNGYKPKASPTGSNRQRKTPSQLPRLETPTEHEDLRSDSDLRTSRYDRVPPVKEYRPRYQSPDGGDSWGEDAESSDSEDEMQMAYPIYPHPYPYPLYHPPHPQAYPYHYPPPHSYIPPPPIKSKSRSKKKVRYAEEPEYLKGKTPTMWRSPEGHSRSPGGHMRSPELSYIQPSSYDVFDPKSNPVLQRYQYQYIQQSYQKKNKLLHEVSRHLTSSPEFARQFVDDFIQDYLDEELIPDLLIDVLSNEFRTMPRDHPYYRPSFDVCVKVLDEDMPELIREVVTQATAEMVDSYLDTKRRIDPLGDNVESIVNEVVETEMLQVVKDTVHDITDDHLDKALAYDVTFNIMTELIFDIAPQLIEDSLVEVAMEEFILGDIIQPAVDNGCQEVAMETLNHYDNKIRKQELRHVLGHAGGQLLDSVMLECLVNLLARQGQIWSVEQSADHVMDSMVLSVLLEQYFGVLQTKRTTIDSQPLKLFHEKATADVALDVLLGELGLSLDEDLADLDEHEQGLWNPDNSQPPDWAAVT